MAGLNLVDTLGILAALVVLAFAGVVGVAWHAGINGRMPVQTCVILAVSCGVASAVARYPLGLLPAVALGAIALYTTVERRVRHWIQDTCQAVFATFHTRQRPRTTEEIMVDAHVGRFEVGAALYLLIKSSAIETTDGEDMDVHASLYRLPLGAYDASKGWDRIDCTISTCGTCHAEVIDHGLPRCETCHLVLPPPDQKRCDVCFTVTQQGNHRGTV